MRPHDPARGRWHACACERTGTRGLPKRCGIGASDGGRQPTDNPWPSGWPTPRSGLLRTYTPEQICAVIAMTCEKPSESERPISHWSQPEIADEAIRPGLVPSISQRSWGVFEKRSRPQRMRPLLATPKPESAFDTSAPTSARFTRLRLPPMTLVATVSIDGMTGIQALSALRRGCRGTIRISV